MDGRFNWLPGQARFWAVFAVWLIPPALAFAQQEPVGPSNDPAAQAAAEPRAGSGKAAGDILNLDIEQLARTPVVVPSMDIPVTSVTKTPSTVGHSAAAIFVITPEMIRRSGATSIPEALRMAPGLDVAQVNSNTWAITSRGFNSAYAYKLLVLIDGRTVYNPDFSGVFWNAQDVLLEDVERIEVIRGPGGTLWGANAVNGVINVITKKAKDTQGVYATAGGGSQLKDAEAFRYGGRIGEDIQYRIYGKHFEQGAGFDPTGQVDDSWRQGRFGFRADWEPDRDKTNSFTIQGDHYAGTTNNSIIPTSPALPNRQNGENLLARWHHVYDEDSDWTLQMYYDNFMNAGSLQTWNDKTFDVDFQYRFPLTERHKITCGGGFRNVDSYLAGGDTFTTWYPSPYFTTNYTNEFIQDEMAIIEDKLNFTLGCKVEQNPYTGVEYEPTARLLWMLDHRHSAWGAVSRAVRTPSRNLEQISLTLPPLAPGIYPRVFGNGNARTEAVLSYELGYREQATEQFSWDIALFYNTYDHLMDTLMGTPFGEGVPLPPHLVIPQAVDSGPTAETYGAELTGNYSVSERWRLYAQYSLLQLHIYADPTQNTPGGNAPCNQVYLRSAWDLNDNLEFDMTARYVDRLVDLQIPSYITMDLRLAWRPRKQLELAVVGQNLLQDHHWEYAGNSMYSPNYASEVPRGVYGTLTWRY
jgi:iron complex outermembrane receptor protein